MKIIVNAQHNKGQMKVIIHNLIFLGIARHNAQVIVKEK
jgi:hypothetical protein